jgi:hypothetical protein
MPETDSASIVAKIDLASVAGWNLRALLLRLLDGEDWQERATIWDARAALDSVRAGLGVWRDAGTDVGLTPLGREVAERLRPFPWGAGGQHGDWLIEPGGGATGIGQITGGALVARIAALLTQDDLRAAKTYRTEAP